MCYLSIFTSYNLLQEFPSVPSYNYFLFEAVAKPRIYMAIQNLLDCSISWLRVDTQCTVVDGLQAIGVPPQPDCWARQDELIWKLRVIFFPSYPDNHIKEKLFGCINSFVTSILQRKEKNMGKREDIMKPST